MCHQVNKTELLSTYDMLNDSTASISYGQCEIAVSTNSSGLMTEAISIDCPDGHHFPHGQDMTMASEWDLVCEKVGVVESVQFFFQMGGAISGLIIPNVGDYFGRKLLLTSICIFCLVVQFSIAFAPNIQVVSALTFIQGIGMSSCISTSMVIGAELLVPRHRTTFGTFHCVMWGVALLVFTGISYLLRDAGWRSLQLAGAGAGIFSLALPFILYESPRWLASKGKWDEALKILKKACKMNGTDFEKVREKLEEYKACKESKDAMNNQRLQDETKCQLGISENDDKTIGMSNEYSPMAVEIKSQVSSRIKLGGTIRSKTSLLNMCVHLDTLLMLLCLWFINMTCYMVYNGLYLSATTMAGDRYVNFVLMSLTEIPSMFFAFYCMAKMGRLQVCRIFFTLSGIFLVASTLLAHFGGDSDVSRYSSVLFNVLGLFCQNCVFTTTLIVNPEVFPTVIRNAGMGSCASIPRIGAMLAPYSRPLYAIAPWAPGTIFASMSFLSVGATFALPETKGAILTTDLTGAGNKSRKKWKH